ncbi:aldo/keto reductase [Tautonia sociabilis]|uniref:Aldo/keto reductase n=1 Tax=Tautonia sociabilis TaxID=2080755 RepID=A0A432MIU5_9BACT|nr:aldo/keto reductase [Tautonia sociabilis]RUL87076.1 aldo/keto reductase [Tautonia sociabilis]
MERTRLGPDGPLISRLGLGGCPIGGHGWGHVDDHESAGAVRRALDLGIDHFDTADVYGLGHSEEVLASALGPDRERVVVATKFGVRRADDGAMTKDASPAHLRRALEGSLRRLRLDCIPLYYLHWPDGRTPIEETMLELLRRRDAGQIRMIGLSNVGPELIERALAVGPVHAVQLPFSLVDRGALGPLRAIADRERITVVTWGSLAQGLLTGKFTAGSTFDRDDRRHRYDNFSGDRFLRNLRVADAVREAAEGLGQTPAQVALRWVLDQPGVGVALFGAKRPEQVVDNAGALDRPLPAEVVRRLSEEADAALLEPLPV